MRIRLAAILGLWLGIVVPALAQTSESLPIVGVLRISTPENAEPFPTVFRDALASLGWIDGRNIRIDLRLAEGHSERFPELAQGLVREKASVIVASGDAAVRAAQQATGTIPIIGIVDDIVGAGLIESFAHPVGNTTGVSILAGELDAKRLALLKELVPTAPRFAVLHDPANATAKPAQLADAARQLGIELNTIDVRNPADFAPAFGSFQTSRSNGLLMASSPLVFAYRAKLCELSLNAKLPAITQFREMADAGCLMSYGIRISDAFTIAAGMADKMLKGAQPRDTLAEQPTKFELVLNLKTAKALGITVPQSLLARADEVIE